MVVLVCFYARIVGILIENTTGIGSTLKGGLLCLLQAKES